MAKTYKDLIVWQIGVNLKIEVYRLIDATTAVRDYRFRDQLRDAVAGIPTNIADGFPRKGIDFSRFVLYARSVLE